MSNRRKLRTADAGPVERCTSCGRRIGAQMDVLRLRTGQVVCPRCRQHGELPRLACGHVVPAGGFVVRNVGGQGELRCPSCEPDRAAEAAAAVGKNATLGLAPRKGSR